MNKNRDPLIRIRSLLEISDPNFVYNTMRAREDTGLMVLQLIDGEVTLPARHAIFNIVAWQVYFRLEIVPGLEDVIEVPTMTDNALATIHTKMYLKLLKVSGLTQPECLKALADNVSDFSNFSTRWCRSYAKAISILGLCKMLRDPKLKELTDADVDSSIGTEKAEEIITAQAARFIKLLSTPGAVKDNVLLDFMETGQLKLNQIPQVLMRFGCRADTDDNMMSAVVNSSNISGLKNIVEYAVEGLGSKKSNLYAKTIIKDAQYFARRLRLVTAAMRYLHPGDCGGNLTYPIELTPALAKNAMNKVIDEEGKRIVLDERNMNTYIGKTVNMVSAFGCRHSDGVCEACAGRAIGDEYNHVFDISLVTAFTPPGQHVGIRAATEVGRIISQMILSAKHLIATKTKDYSLPEGSKTYLVKTPLNITWKKKKWAELKKYYLHIPVEGAYSLRDLEFVDAVMPETFSEIQHFELRRLDGTLVEQIELAPGEFRLYLSSFMLSYITLRIDEIPVENDRYVIPLSGYDFSKPLINFSAFNDDMVAFTRRVATFFDTKIKKYKSLPTLMRELTELLYEKASVNLFYVEIVVRAFLIEEEDDYRIPAITDIENLKCKTIREVITNREVSAKIAFELINKYFSETATFNIPKSPGMFDNYIGLD